MNKIAIRLQKLADASRFYEILNNPNFIYFSSRSKSIEDEEKWLRNSFKLRRKRLEFHYTIIYDGKIVGGIGVKINPRRNYIGEIGYFLDEDYWGRGITTSAVGLVEDVCFKELGLSRIEIIMQPANIASEKVAIKCGYLKEGLLKKVIKAKDGQMKDCYLYAKVC